MGLKWNDSREIAILLEDSYPDVDNLNLRFTDLHKWIISLKILMTILILPMKKFQNPFKWLGLMKEINEIEF